MVGIYVDSVHYESLRDSVTENAQALTNEKREHGTTKRRLDTFHTQCEDMLKEMVVLTGQRDAATDELAEERRLNNAALKPTQIHAEDTRDALACMAEEVAGLEMKLEEEQTSRAGDKEYIEGLRSVRDGYKQQWKDALAERDAAANLADNYNGKMSRIKDELKLCEKYLAKSCEKKDELLFTVSNLKESAETQARHMQDVDAACKAAEAKVIEQRKEIEALKSGDDLWICPSADGCVVLCDHKKPHKKTSQCQRKCRLLDAPRPPCVPTNTCKECATLREEIINRNAVIVQQESRAEDREEIIKALAKEIKMMRQGEIVATGSGGGQSRCGDEPTLTLGKFKIAFSGKREGMVKQGVHTRLLRNGDIVTVNPVMTIREV
ncbi:MAG: hypothetical protein KAJ03_01185 [Gammaproteobacteria bacterium]|nr:hypothetical protein [Gammaproteobacteria bacterium]